MGKPILCLDFDGVIHSYSSGWQGAGVIPDLPVPGAYEFIMAALEAFDVQVYSSRSGQKDGINAMQRYLIERVELPVGVVLDRIGWPDEKPPAMVTLDDRALTFDGTWPTIAALKTFQPWNKRTPRSRPTVEELEAILKSNDDRPISINPDGSISVAQSQP